MPPRARSPSASSSTDSHHSSNRQKLYQFAPLFDEDASTDLILICLDGLAFALSRSTLRIHAPAFEAILPPALEAHHTPSSSTSRSHSGGVTGEGQAVNISELAVPFELFLRHTIPSKYLDPQGSPPKFPVYKYFADVSPPVPDRRTPKSQAHLASPPTLLVCSLQIVVLENVLDLAHRYQLPLVFDVVSRIQLAVLNKTSPLRGFAIAARFGRLEDAKESIRGLCHRKFVHPGARKWMIDSGVFLEGWRDACLGDLALATLVYVPMSAVRNFTIVHARVVASQDGSYTWINAATDFNLYSIPSSIALRSPSALYPSPPALHQAITTPVPFSPPF